MWVYPSDEVRTSPETTALLPQLPAESGTPKQSVPEPLNAGEAMPAGGGLFAGHGGCRGFAGGL